jgi:hypothetical protein
MKITLRRLVVGSIALAAMSWAVELAQSASAAVAEAFVGEPFGVGSVTLAVGGAGPVAPLEDDRFTVVAAEGRALYPVVKEERARRLIRRLLEIDRPRTVTMYFLFRGEAPLDLRAFAPNANPTRVTPFRNPAAHARLLDEWREQYVNHWQNLRQDPAFPPVVENFIAANLARRMGFELPVPRAGLLSRLTSGMAPEKTPWDDLLITERHQLSIDLSLIRGQGDGAPPPLQPISPIELERNPRVTRGEGTAAELQPLPPPMPWYDLPAPSGELKAVPVEPMAAHVPVECFYLRFGEFENYLWFRDLNRKWQGDLGNMVMRRAVDSAANERLEQQLSLRENALAKILGPQLIADVAIIGLDPYINHGAAIGVLFQARVSPLLARDLTAQRREALTKFADAAETTVKIGDRDVSLIATPGGEVRSYYVADGDFHLVTTSLRLVQRFLQAGAGERPLAESTGFLTARQRLPHDRDDAIFAYLSPEFVRELTSPATWIESQRRAASAREVKLWELARLQAAAEGVAARSLDELVAAGLLPQRFGRHADGSELQENDGDVADSRRGRPGLFTPVCDVDMEVAGATATEAAAYRRFGDRFRQEIGQTPPIAVGVQRAPLADGSGETLAADVVATPLEHVKLGRLPDILGEPSAERVAPVEGDVARAEFVLAAPPLPLLGGENELHHLFVGVRDFRTPLVVERGAVAPGAPPTELVRMYVGAWPKPGLLKLFAGPHLAESPEPLPAPNDVWQAKREDFLLMSFKPDVVHEVLPQLSMAPAARPGQIWIDVANLADKQLAGAVNAYGYMRTREASLAASRLMNALVSQLHVPQETAREVAERLMDGKFVCPLGGEYELVEAPGGQPAWTSTAVAPQNRFLLTAPPEDFMLPVLTWFKGLRGDLRLEAGELAVHVEIDIAKSAMP